MNTTTNRRVLAAAAAAGILSLIVAAPASAKPEWNEPAAVPVGTSPTPAPEIQIREVLVDDDAWEYAQLGLGAAVGAAAVGAAVIAVRRREQRAPHPA